jgi:hypothetical protein
MLKELMPKIPGIPGDISADALKNKAKNQAA